MIDNNTILFIVNSLSFGGAGKMVHYVAGLMVAEGYHVKAVATNDKNITIINNGVDYCALALKVGGLLGRLRTIKAIRKLIKRTSPNICVSFVSDIAFSSVVATRFLSRRPIIVSAERGDPFTLPILWQYLCKWAYNQSDYCFFQLKKACCFFGDKVKGHSFIIPNAIIQAENVQVYDGKRNKTIVSAGRFEAQKDFELLIKAFSKIRKIHPDYNLVLYGDGSLKTKYKNLCHQLNIEKYVTFPGYVTNVSEHIYKEGIFVLSTFYEGIPNVLIEALAIGIPTVSSDCSPGGPAFLTDNGRRGLLVPVGDVDSMVHSINRIIEDDNLAKNLSFYGLEIKDELSPVKINKMWADSFRQMKCRK